MGFPFGALGEILRLSLDSKAAAAAPALLLDRWLGDGLVAKVHRCAGEPFVTNWVP
jgi:hypothetical protein